MAKTYKAGAIGRTGRGNFGHGLHTCYADVPNVDLVAVADDDEDGRAKAVADTGAERSYADYREMLEKEDLDIVSVCPRWVDCHLDMILATLDAGCHVYSEKPMTASPEDADRVIERAEERGLRMAVAHQAAYLPQIQQAIDLIRSGKIGDVISVRSAGKQDHRGGGEDLLVLGTHLFNLMRLVVGDARTVFACVTHEGAHLRPEHVREAGEPIGWIAGDRVHAFYEFESGVTATFESRQRQIRDGRPYGMEIVGESGTIAFDASASNISLLEDNSYAPWVADQERKPLNFEKGPLMSGNALAIEDLIEAVEGGREPISSARGARMALEMILGVYASEIAGERVSLPLADRRHPLEVFKRGG